VGFERWVISTRDSFVSSTLHDPIFDQSCHPYYLEPFTPKMLIIPVGRPLTGPNQAKSLSGVSPEVIEPHLADGNTHVVRI
jgi:hypothetical protein